VKFRCERDPLVEAITVAQRGVTGKGGGLASLNGLLLKLDGDELNVTGTDRSLTISVKASVSGERNGAVVVSAKLLADIVRALPSGAVVVECDDEEFRIGSGRSQFALRTIPAQEFPQIPQTAGNSVTLDATAFADALRQVVIAAATEETRMVLTGVLMAAEGDGLRLAATDSYRLAVRDIAGQAVLSEGQQVLVPSSHLKELTRLLSSAETVVLRLGEHDASFELGNVRLMCQLLDGDFPNYRGLIPTSYPNRVHVEREAFLDALRRVRLLAKDSTPVRLHIKSDSIELVAMSPEIGQAQEEVDARNSGDELTVAFNPEYLAAGIDVTGGEEITLETIDASKPAIIRGAGDDNFLYLLMPIRVP